MLLAKNTETMARDESFVIRQLKRIIPVTTEFSESHFTTRQAGRLMLTPLAIALVLVETMDLVFALDSIPATFAITTDPFLVFTSNVFAILGLRSLYFALAGAIERFRYLTVSLSVILGLIGAKMVLADITKAQFGTASTLYVLGIVVLILVIGMVASLIVTKRENSRR
jgi:tellurite resistance protein TerC